MPFFGSVEIERAADAHQERVSRELDFDVLFFEVSNRAEDIARMLFGEPNKHQSTSRELRFGSKGSLCVPTSTSNKAGTYFDHEAQKGGSLFDLVQESCGLGFFETVVYLVQNCGVAPAVFVDGRLPPESDPARQQISQEAMRARREAAAIAAAEDRERRIGNALTDWQASKSIIGTPAETYLTKTRSLGLPGADKILARSDLPIRFDEKDCSLVLAFSTADGQFQGIQKTYLTLDGQKREDQEPVRRAFGDLHGAAVQLPALDPARADRERVLAEGGETGMSVWLATGVATSACLSTRFVDAARASSEPVLWIAAENDPQHSPALLVAQEAQQTLIQEGRTVHLVRATGFDWQEPGDKSDWNDVLSHEGGAVILERFTGSAAPSDAEPGLDAFWIEEFAADNTPEPDPYITKLLYPRSFMMVAGPPKSMKSMWVQHLMVHSAAIGGEFFGFEAARPRTRVFYINAEMDYFLFRKRVKDMKLPMWALEKLHRNMLVTDRFKFLLDHEGGPQLVDLAHRFFGPDDPPDVIVIDPLANVFPGEDENNNTEMMKFLTGNLEALREKINPDAAIVIVHHAAKALIRERQAGATDPFNSIRGAGALRGYYDTGIVIERVSYEDNLRRISFDTRRDEAPPVMFTRFQDGAFHQVEAPEGPGKANTVQKEAAVNSKYSKIKELLSEELSEHGNMMSVRAFSLKYSSTNGLGGRPTVEGLVREMLAKGALKTVGPHDYERVTEDFETMRDKSQKLEFIVPVDRVELFVHEGPSANTKISVVW